MWISMAPALLPKGTLIVFFSFLFSSTAQSCNWFLLSFADFLHSSPCNGQINKNDSQKWDPVEGSFELEIRNLVKILLGNSHIWNSFHSKMTEIRKC